MKKNDLDTTAAHVLLIRAYNGLHFSDPYAALQLSKFRMMVITA
jgi:hypothetical protein